ncbi:hypothetical protein BaRGS_00011033 [Batillaria attramentaria]|uniref:Uncharacterized protein n=1 Tax=Batillaria attramentaria TaxID=370345 RepID=A0ABD0LEJ8_9CAEN
MRTSFSFAVNLILRLATINKAATVREIRSSIIFLTKSEVIAYKAFLCTKGPWERLTNRAYGALITYAQVFVVICFMYASLIWSGERKRVCLNLYSVLCVSRTYPGIEVTVRDLSDNKNNKRKCYGCDS